ncbi:hypothetical protein B0H16DRAFT_1715337 [Mycena metata]|uniref:Uncharacterized protein n=1 Tax=Mycena metata TaxID=1033252 RepID=A0AAD7NQD0_9AGAR|nr:hypothetical protein B0H16DRAFT_1715337 [Mycena metata]
MAAHPAVATTTALSKGVSQRTPAKTPTQMLIQARRRWTVHPLPPLATERRIERNSWKLIVSGRLEGVATNGTTTTPELARERQVLVTVNGAFTAPSFGFTRSLMYNHRNRELLANKQRDVRKRAYVKKHGAQVYIYRKYSNKATPSTRKPATADNDDDGDAEQDDDASSD